MARQYPREILLHGKTATQLLSHQKPALNAAADLKEKREVFGTQIRAISPSLAEQATAVFALLEPLGISLLDAISRFVETENRIRASVTIDHATLAFQNGKDALGDKQANAYRLRGEKLVAAFPGRTLSTFTGEELQQHLEDTTGGSGSFNQGYRLIRAIWK